MLNVIRQWVTGLVAVSIFCGIASAIAPQGKMRRAVMLTCAFLAAAALIAPLDKLADLNFDSLLEQFSLESEQSALALKEVNGEMQAGIIEEQCEAYILDKAKSYGMSITVTVTAVEKEGGLIPDSCEIFADCGENLKALLCGDIENELGIPAEKQHWSKE